MRIAYNDTTCLQLHSMRGALFGTPITTTTTLTWQLMGSPKYCFATPIAKRKRTKKYIIMNTTLDSKMKKTILCFTYLNFQARGPQKNGNVV